MAELAVAGFFVIRTISKRLYGLIADTSESQARSTRGMIVIAGYLAMVAIAISIMAADRTATVVIRAVSGIILGVSIQSLIGNAIAGMVLAITSPFASEILSRCFVTLAKSMILGCSILP